MRTIGMGYWYGSNSPDSPGKDPRPFDDSPLAASGSRHPVFTSQDRCLCPSSYSTPPGQGVVGLKVLSAIDAQ